MEPSSTAPALRPPASFGLQPLRWTMGGLCGALGALLLVAPHRFAAPLPAVASEHPVAWGAVALVAGVGLLAVAVLHPGRRAVWTAHLLAGATLLALAVTFAFGGIWVATTTYVLLGIGVIATARRPLLAPVTAPSRDLFAALLGVVASLNGAALLAWPDSTRASYFDRSRALLPWLGGLLLGAGLLLLLTQLLRRPPRALRVGAHLAAASAFLAFGLVVSLPQRAWTALAVNWGYALAVGLVPWLARSATPLRSPPLRVRLAFLLATAACLALILTGALAAYVVEATSSTLAEAGIRRARDATLTLLVLVAPLAVLGGVLLARRIARPLGGLAEAVAGDVLPGDVELTAAGSGVAEIDRLAHAFAELRERLAERTAEGERLAGELRARADALAEADRRKDEFLAMLGHELRNPLGAIVSSTSLLQQAPEGHPARTRAVTIIERQTQQLVRMVDDLLDVARITRGKVRLQIAPLDLAEVVRRVADTLRAPLDAKRHRLEVRLDAERLPVRGDAARLEQVVGNLLANAVKYTPPGGNLMVRGELAGDQVVLTFRDDGVGIDPALLPRVFDLFVQGQQPLDRTASGLGIGLTLVRTVVELHGGSVQASSRGPGSGTEIVVRLPLDREAVAAPAAAAAT
jgi:signal transduction histidine kinase